MATEDLTTEDMAIRVMVEVMEEDMEATVAMEGDIIDVALILFRYLAN